MASVRLLIQKLGGAMNKLQLLKTCRALPAVALAVSFALSPQAVYAQAEMQKSETKIEEKQPMAENVLLGNISAGRGADYVASEIRRFNPFIRSIVIYNKEQAEFLGGYEKTRSQLQDLSFKYQSLLAQQKNLTSNIRNNLPQCVGNAVTAEPDLKFIGPLAGITAGITAASGAVDAFNKLISYFGMTVSLRPEVFDPDQRVITAEVFRGLRQRYGNNIELYNQNSIPPTFSSSELVKEIQKNIQYEEEAAANNVLLAERLSRINCLPATNSAAYEDEKQRLVRWTSEYQKNSNQLAAIIKGLTGEVPAAAEEQSEDEQANAAGKSNKTSSAPDRTFLTAYLTVENVYRMIRKNDNGYWLEIKAITAGGTTRVKSNPIVDVFRGGGRISHSGASLLEYNLYDKNGMSVLSGIVPDYIPYTKARNIPGLVRQNRELSRPDPVDARRALNQGAQNKTPRSN